MPEFNSRCDPAPPEVNKRVMRGKDGKVTALGRYCAVVSSGDVAVKVRIPGLREIETVLDVKIYTSPATYCNWYSNMKITGNIVGLTLWQINAGTTLTVEAIGVGSP